MVNYVLVVEYAVGEQCRAFEVGGDTIDELRPKIWGHFERYGSDDDYIEIHTDKVISRELCPVEVLVERDRPIVRDQNSFFAERARIEREGRMR